MVALPHGVLFNKLDLFEASCRLNVQHLKTGWETLIKSTRRDSKTIKCIWMEKNSFLTKGFQKVTLARSLRPL